MIENPDRKSVGTSWSRRHRRAVIASAIFHVVLIVALFCLYRPSEKSVANTNRTERFEQDRSNLPAENPPIAQPPDPNAERIRQSVESEIAASSTIPDEQKLSDLDANLKRITSTADGKDLDQIAKTIADVMGLNRNQYDDQKPADQGSLDINAAQLLDVQRTQDESGQWSYQAVMIDTSGRNEIVPLSEAEGQTAYETFEKLKQYPMADSIYRQLVMPMIQRVLDAK